MPVPSHHFVPVWPSLEAEKTYRSKEYGPSRKRKRQSAHEDSDDDDDNNNNDEITYSQPITTNQLGNGNRIDHAEPTGSKDPRQVAGYPRHLSLPHFPFPHAPVKEPRRDATAETAQRNLAALKPPLYIPPVSEKEDARTSLRRHHLGVMTTIMHTSLLRGDYVRAGRAWGMILRTEVLGRSADVRTHERWGIGAEILLRQHVEHPVRPALEIEEDQDAEKAASNEITFTKEGFQLANSYYKRLILQYPYQKTNPNLINDLHFLPAMFGLEIYEIQQAYKQALRTIEGSSASPLPSPYDTDDGSEQGVKDGDKSVNVMALDIKRSIVDMIIDLAGRMDEPMLSPPYKTYAPLVELRAMVSQWTVDSIKDMMALAGKLDPKYDSRLARETERVRTFVEHVKHQGGTLPEFFVLNE